MGRWTRTYVDTSDDRPHFSMRIPDLTGDITAELAALNTFAISLEAITLLNPLKTDIVAQTIAAAGGQPANNLAQKEIAFVMHYHDSVTGRPFVLTIPGADTTFLLPFSNEVDLTNATIVSFVTNFEAVAQTVDGNAPVVDKIVLKK